jgi:glycosyltransferase involved in cell wall biosynthesis
MATTGSNGTRVAFVAPACVLDTGSGAALSARTMLEMLAAEGFECLSFTPSVFDGLDEFPLRRVFNAEAAKPGHAGKIVQVSHGGVTHQVFRTASTVGTKATEAELTGFLDMARARMQAFAPHVMLSYGSSAFAAHVLRTLRPTAGRLAFYLANDQIVLRELFDPVDAVLCPSEVMVALCKERFGREARVLRDPISPRNAADPAETLAVQAPESRGQGFVTFINPTPVKGTTLVLALAQKALRERPDLTFLIVESRVRKAFWDTDTKFLKRDLPNVWWVPSQPDLRRIYQRTSVLLFPSFWQEASGRSIAEAQLGGIPVLASRRGGIAEQLNGGGFLFDVPEQFHGRDAAVPGDGDIAPWLATLCRLVDDEAFYRQASARALEAAAPFRWQRQRGEIAALFNELAA